MRVTVARSLALIALCCVPLAIGACGSSAKRDQSISAGQQLQALREALDSGAITREEYERERRAIIGVH